MFTSTIPLAKIASNQTTVGMQSMLEETRKSFENLLKSWKADQSKMTRLRSGRDIKNKRALIKIVSNLSKAIDGVHDLLEHTNKTELKNEKINTTVRHIADVDPSPPASSGWEAET